jgi:RNA polymerase sigma factor (sigma-70 family)
MNAVAVVASRSTRVSIVPQHEAATTRISPGGANARFRSVVLPHLDDAYALARWLTGSRADSEDVVQDACLRALRGIGNFSSDNARAWVLTIVRHTTYSWLQKNRPAAAVLEALESIGGTHTVEFDAETPETALISRDDLTLLNAAIAALPIPLRETLVLREIRELSYQEIAKATGVPIGTVMSRLARARGRIVSLMTRDGSRRS